VLELPRKTEDDDENEDEEEAFNRFVKHALRGNRAIPFMPARLPNQAAALKD